MDAWLHWMLNVIWVKKDYTDQMYLIQLHDLFFRAPIGVFPEEKILGTDLVLQVQLEMNQEPKDSLSDYVDYVQAYQIISETLKTGFDLLEQAAEAIIEKLFSLHTNIYSIKISIQKVYPPIKQFEGKVSVTISKTR